MIGTLGALETRLRRMLGHLGPRDRQTILDAIEANHELATRLYAANHRTEPQMTANHRTTRAAGGTDG